MEYGVEEKAWAVVWYGNVIFDFPDVESIVTHGTNLSWVYYHYDDPDGDWTRIPYTRRGILPIIQPNDPFYDFVKRYTTPAPTTKPRPPPTTTTLKPVQAGSAPNIIEIEEDSVDDIVGVIEPPISKNVPAISRLPFIYYTLGYATVHLKTHNTYM
uniref:Tudor domain-containing protein n=1 Tax=Bursaphelenchus xylophilus TaxID=6326 RepID=A0A1I7SK35_BURXY